MVFIAAHLTQVPHFQGLMTGKSMVDIKGGCPMFGAIMEL